MTASTTSSPRGLARRLGSESLIYGLGGVANQAVAVLLVPIYARELGPSGVGITGVLNSTISLVLMLAGLALPQAFFRWYLREADDDRTRSQVLGTILALRIAGSLLAFAFVLLAAIPITNALYDGAYLAVFALAAPIVTFDSFNQVPLSYLRAERKAGSYIRVTLTRAILGSVAIVSLVVILGFGVLGVAIGSAIAATTSAAIGAWVVFQSGIRPRLDPLLARAMLRFALPLIPAGVAGWVLNLLDRPLLQLFTGSTATVGVYSLGYTIGLMTNALVVQPFALAWGAAHWELSRQPDATSSFARVLTWFLTIASGAALLISALGTDAIRILVGDAFEMSRFVVPFSAFAYVMYGSYSIVAAGLGIVGRSGLVAAATGIAATVSVVLNLVLIPAIGLFGAATSTLASYIVLALVSGTLSNRFYPVRWAIGPALLILTVASALTVAALLGPDHVLWRVACVAAYPLIMLGIGILAPSSLRDLIRSLRGT